MGKRVHLGVTGSIAAYRALDLVRALQEADCAVSATLTPSARRFIQPLSFQALGADPVYSDMFAADGADENPFAHLEPGQTADVFAVVPASADVMARIANGRADDMAACQALAFPGPKIMAPAMNPVMWEAPPTQRNWETLKADGWIPVEPDCGRVACGDTGRGRLAAMEDILTAILTALSPQDLAGKKVVVTLGPTQERWDAVRFWSNPSTGAMGAAMAMAAHLRGAEVTVIAGPTSLTFPAGIEVVNVVSARQMHAAAMDLWPSMDIGCATAAVSDFRPVPYGDGKYKKAGATDDDMTVQFEANPDILMDMGVRKKKNQQLLGFAAETDNLQAEAQRKLARKRLDLIAANDVNREGSGFGVATNAVHVLDAKGRRETWPQLSKTEVAWRLWDHLLLD